MTGSDGPAALYAARFEGDLAGELRAWLHVAARRESCIIELHRNLVQRSELASPTTPAMEVAREVFALIAKHERGHLDFVESALTSQLFSTRVFAADLLIWLASTEGAVLDTLTSRIRAETDLGEALSVCSAFERTAHQSYVRLERLARALRKVGDGNGELDGLVTELRLKVLEEDVHDRTFREMATWASGSDGAAEISRRECVQRLARLLPREAAGDQAGPPRVLTDAGLGALFARDDLA